MERVELNVASPSLSFESEDDGSSVSSSASSPMSISSVEASSPYGETVNEDADFSGSDTSDAVDCCSSRSVSSSSSTSSSPYYRSRQPSSYSCNPYNSAKSVRWFRDDRGLWSESQRRSPYQRPVNATTERTKSNDALIDAVRRQDLAEIRNLLANATPSEPHARHQHHLAASNLNVLGSEGDSALHRSCRTGNLDLVKLLVSSSLRLEFF